MQEVMKEITAEDGVKYVQPNYRYKAAEADTYNNNNNPHGQWYLDNIKARSGAKLLEKYTNNKKIKVSSFFA
jgi:hypothetical protein